MQWLNQSPWPETETVRKACWLPFLEHPPPWFAPGGSQILGQVWEKKLRIPNTIKQVLNVWKTGLHLGSDVVECPPITNKSQRPISFLDKKHWRSIWRVTGLYQSMANQVLQLPLKLIHLGCRHSKGWSRLRTTAFLYLDLMVTPTWWR